MIKYLLYILLILGCIVGHGCMFKDLKEELVAFDQTYFIRGQVLAAEPVTAPVMVILFAHTDAGGEEIRQVVFAGATRDFSFVVPEGRYVLAAFEDVNSNMMVDAGEPAGIYGQPDTITIEAEPPSEGDRDVSGLVVRLSPSVDLTNAFPGLADTSLFAATSLVRLGTMARLDDPAFAPENGSLGYWKPATFLKQLGVGIYFTEPYDPQKIPVLFVHGAVGTPRGFEALIQAMDPNRYQPWFFYYPSGVRLESISDALTEVVTQLRQHHGFNTLVVTAHSMGGLVSRAFINRYALTPTPADTPVFVSISTPWGGSHMAAKGAKQAPVAIPSWHDMAPDSDFIRRLFAEPLPSMVAHHLFFGFKGDCSLFMANNDGTVELESQLDYRAQRDALSTVGFNEDHMSILECRELTSAYGRILGSLANDPDGQRLTVMAREPIRSEP